MHALGVLAHLAADDALRERMVGGAADLGDAAVRDGDVEAATGRTVVRAHRVHDRILDYDAADVRADGSLPAVQDPRCAASRDALRGRVLLAGHVLRGGPGAKPRAERDARALPGAGRHVWHDRPGSLAHQARLRLDLRRVSAVRPAAQELLPAHLGARDARGPRAVVSRRADLPEPRHRALRRGA